IVDDGDYGCFRDLLDHQRRRLKLLGVEAVAGHVDYVVDPARDAEVAVRSLHRAVPREVRPVVRVLPAGSGSAFSSRVSAKMPSTIGPQLPGFILSRQLRPD